MATSGKEYRIVASGKLYNTIQVFGPTVDDPLYTCKIPSLFSLLKNDMFMYGGSSMKAETILGLGRLPRTCSGSKQIMLAFGNDKEPGTSWENMYYKSMGKDSDHFGFSVELPEWEKRRHFTWKTRRFGAFIDNYLASNFELVADDSGEVLARFAYERCNGSITILAPLGGKEWERTVVLSCITSMAFIRKRRA